MSSIHVVHQNEPLDYTVKISKYRASFSRNTFWHLNSNFPLLINGGMSLPRKRRVKPGARALQIWKGASHSAGRQGNAHSSLNNVSSNEGLHKSNSVLGNCNAALW